MKKPAIAVFTAWPDLIHDLHNHFEVHVHESMQSSLISTFADQNIDHGLIRFAVRVHDRNQYPDYEYVLYVTKPLQVDLHDLKTHIDDQHNVVMDENNGFLLYHRRKTWSIKQVSALGYTEILPNEPGIIFIDCWQKIADSSWHNLPGDFDYYKTMKRILCRYRPKNLVFHTGEFGSLPLATDLLDWYHQGNSIDIMQITHFERHYQARNIFNWIVVGAHWRRCTHEKPLGFYNLLDLKNLDPRLRIFSQMNCTVKFINNDLENPEVALCDESDYTDPRGQQSLIWQANGKLPELVGLRNFDKLQKNK